MRQSVRNVVASLAWVFRTNKLLGVAAFVVLLYAALVGTSPRAGTAENHHNLAERLGELGLICVGVGVLIVAGGIDLSIGSTLCLAAALMTWLFNAGVPALGAMLLTLLAGCLIGLFHGLLVTKLRIQAFVVTLCGLFIYRGLARFLAGDAEMTLKPGFPEAWMRALAGDVGGTRIPIWLVMLAVVAVLTTVFLHFTVWGRYLAAIGSNEKAVRYSGVPTDRYKILAYVICSVLAAFAGILYLMKYNNVQATTVGQMDELYAIAGAVLGGCSLRGGEGTVPGMILGAAILTLLPNLAFFRGIPDQLTNVAIGAALLVGAILDDQLRQWSRRRRM